MSDQTDEAIAGRERTRQRLGDKTLPAAMKPGEVGVHDIPGNVEEEMEPWTRALIWLIREGPLKNQACEIRNSPDSPWVTVDKLERGERVEPRFAIWRRTGAVHRVQEAGDPYPEAVEDDPIWTPQ